MIQSKFKIEEEQAEFLNNFKFYGYKDKSSLVRAALDRLKKELETNSNPNAVELYAAMSEIAGAMEPEDTSE